MHRLPGHPTARSRTRSLPPAETARCCRCAALPAARAWRAAAARCRWRSRPLRRGGAASPGKNSARARVRPATPRRPGQKRAVAASATDQQPARDRQQMRRPSPTLVGRWPYRPPRSRKDRYHGDHGPHPRTYPGARPPPGNRPPARHRTHPSHARRALGHRDHGRRPDRDSDAICPAATTASPARAARRARPARARARTDSGEHLPGAPGRRSGWRDPGPPGPHERPPATPGTPRSAPDARQASGRHAGRLTVSSAETASGRFAVHTW